MELDGEKGKVAERRNSRDCSEWVYRGEGNHNIVIAHKQVIIPSRVYYDEVWAP